MGVHRNRDGTYTVRVYVAYQSTVTVGTECASKSIAKAVEATAKAAVARASGIVAKKKAAHQALASLNPAEHDDRSSSSPQVRARVTSKLILWISLSFAYTFVYSTTNDSSICVDRVLNAAKGICHCA
jgi:hypothetical protein